MKDGAGQREVTLQALLDAAQAGLADVPTVVPAQDVAATAALLDAAARDEPALVFVAAPDDLGARVAEAWAADRDGWLVLASPPPGHGVLAPVSTVARAPLPGSWRGGRRAEAALAARAALVHTQRNEVDRLRAELLDERARVAAEAQRVRSSQSWRVGHGIVRAARLLTFKRDRGTDALDRLVDRMNDPRDP